MKALKNLMVWQNYAHYILLTIGLGLYLQYSQGMMLDFIEYFWLYIVIVVLDTAIHFLFSVLPKPWRWSD